MLRFLREYIFISLRQRLFSLSTYNIYHGWDTKLQIRGKSNSIDNAFYSIVIVGIEAYSYSY